MDESKSLEKSRKPADLKAVSSQLGASFPSPDIPVYIDRLAL